MADEPWGTWGAYQTAASKLLAALHIAVRALRDNDIDEAMAGEFEILTDAIAQAEAAGITTKAAEEVAWNRVL